MNLFQKLTWAGVFLATCIPAFADGNSKFPFALIGDAPYGPATGTAPNRVQVYPAPAYERTIEDINQSLKDNKSFVIHVGDIKEGNSPCDDNIYKKNRDYFNTFEMAAVFVPGDNEWTDCHRTTNGGYDPLERLALLRSAFYPATETLGKKPLTVARQDGYPENSRWQFGPVLFVTLNMPGSNNGFQNASSGSVPNPYRAAMDAEYAARNAANVAWLNESFDLAAADSKIKGVFIAIQANVFERFLESGQTYTISGYADFVSAVRARTVALDRPVLLAHGDTHYFRVDRPMTSTYPACSNATNNPCGTPVPVASSPTDRMHTLLRAEVFAQNDVHWVKVTVDDTDPDIFSVSPQRVAGN